MLPPILMLVPMLMMILIPMLVSILVPEGGPLMSTVLPEALLRCLMRVVMPLTLAQTRAPSTNCCRIKDQKMFLSRDEDVLRDVCSPTETDLKYD